jgi:hypothetical protein
MKPKHLENYNHASTQLLSWFVNHVPEFERHLS